MLVDGYQGIGAIPVEASRVGDAVVGGTVKYLLASAGLAFMALRPGLVEELVPVQTGWFADENVFDMQIERYRPHRSARRFDAGTPPVPNIYAGVAGVGVIAEAGVPAIQEHVRGLVERLLGGLDELGATVAAQPRGPLVAIRSTDAPCARRRARRRRDRRLGAGLEPPRLAPSLQHRRRRRRRPRRAEAVSPAAALAVSRRSAARRREQVRLKAVRKGEPTMSRDLSQNERRLAVLAAIGVLWGALLLAIGFAFFFVVAVIGGLLLAATAVLQGRVIVSTLEPRVRGAGGAAPRCDRRRVGARRPDRLERQARGSRQPGLDRAAAGSDRLAPGGCGRGSGGRRGRVTRAGARAPSARAAPAQPGRNDAMRLNERAAVLRSEERYGEALELSEQALAIFRRARRHTRDGPDPERARPHPGAGRRRGRRARLLRDGGFAPDPDRRQPWCRPRAGEPRRAPPRPGARRPGARRLERCARALRAGHARAQPHGRAAQARELGLSFAGSPAASTSRAQSRRFQSGTGGSQSARGVKRERSTSCSLWM